MKILYFDCFSGISGDMVIGALIDAGADRAHLEAELKKLQIEDEYELEFKKVNKNGITSTKFDVILKEQHHSHSHEHTHEEGHNHHHSHEHSHEEEHHHHHSHEHSHEEGHDHDHSHHHHHDHRSYKHIVEMIKTAKFTDRTEEIALRIFEKIGIAEGKIHGVALDDVHFHEVGAVDSIIDIVGAAILLDQLNVDMIQASPVPVGSGKIHIDHGIYPVPAPATLEILKGIPVATSDVVGELATPTGAAIIATTAKSFGPLPTMTVDEIGYGAGTKTFKSHPNVVRVVIGTKL